MGFAGAETIFWAGKLSALGISDASIPTTDSQSLRRYQKMLLLHQDGPVKLLQAIKPLFYQTMTSRKLSPNPTATLFPSPSHLKKV